MQTIKTMLLIIICKFVLIIYLTLIKSRRRKRQSENEFTTSHNACVLRMNTFNFQTQLPQHISIINNNDAG